MEKRKKKAEFRERLGAPQKFKRKKNRETPK